MKNIILLLSLLMSPQADSVRVMFWNLENFFDCHDGGASPSDHEFSPTGDRHWSWKRFRTKCADIAKAVFWIADESGAMPDLIAVSEVENRSVMRSLLDDTLMRKFNYGLIHYDSPDPRGIDVAMLYDRDRLRLVHSRACPVEGLQTRDLLIARFVTHSGDSLAVIAVHLPSQYGGKSSSGRRAVAVSAMLDVSDSLAAAGWLSQVAIGDFNDVPDAGEFAPLMRSFCNLSQPLAASGEGSIRFNGRWELIDQCHVSADLMESSVTRVCHVPFLTVRDNVYGGLKPWRTYVGPRYAGGVSDHCPIIAYIVTGRERH